MSDLSFEPVLSESRHETEVFADFTALAAEREAIDRAIVAWTENDLTDEILGTDLNFWHTFRNIDVTLPMGLCISHLFNHQTHHRGQETTLLSQMGGDIGATDTPMMPQ